MEHMAILNLYPQIKSCWNEGEVWKFFDENNNEIEVSIDWNAVNTKASELQAIEDAKEQAKIDAKISGNQKLLDLGLSQAEATALTGYTPPSED